VEAEKRNKCIKFKKCTRALFYVLFLSWSLSANAYVQSRTQTDSLVHWTASVNVLDIFLNPTNTQGYQASSVQAQVANAVAQWNGKSRIIIRQNATSFSGQNNINEIYFSTDPSVFGGGTGVVGVTQVLFKNNTGEMLEADILINDDFYFSTTLTDLEYLGNVITHEMGHFMGLGHSQVSGSTMFYALSRGQNQIDEDDKAGVYAIYPTGDTSKGSITGKIVGGPALSAVFGAQVQAISLKTGHVAGANISEIDGRFVIDGLDKNDQYYIFNGPVAQIGLPARFSNARSDFCNSSKKYRGSFYQGCGSSNEGYPQAINLTASTIDIGNVTIRCGLDVPVDYISKKTELVNLFDLQDGVLSGIGNSFVGYFSTQELAQGGMTDHFKINYSPITTAEWSAIASSGDLYLELKVLNQSFFSAFKANVSVSRPSGAIGGLPKYVQKFDGWLSLDSVIRIPINRGNPSDNEIDITITPENMATFEFPTSLPFTKADYFPAPENFEDSVRFYLVSASIVKDNGNSTYSLVSYKNKQFSDNTTCSDAINTYALSNFSATGTSSAPAKKKSEGVACGTVDMSGGSGNGPGGFFIGLILSLILCSLTSSIIREPKSLKL
jgi:predicted Zn-dependent protease